LAGFFGRDRLAARIGTVGQVISCIVVDQRNIGLAIDGTKAQQWTRAAGPPAFAQPYATKAHSRSRRDGADAVRCRGIAVQTRRHPHGDTEHVRNQPARQYERIIALLDSRGVECGLVRHRVDACKRIARPGILVERMANAHQRPSDGGVVQTILVCRGRKVGLVPGDGSAPHDLQGNPLEFRERGPDTADCDQSLGVIDRKIRLGGAVDPERRRQRKVGRGGVTADVRQADRTACPVDDAGPGDRAAYQSGAGRELLPLGRLDLFGLRGCVGPGQHAAQCRDPGVDQLSQRRHVIRRRGMTRQPQQPATLAADGQEVVWTSFCSARASRPVD
jgi:hypothetical protein